MARDQEITVNGVRIGPHSDLVGLFRRALQGEDVFPSRTAYGPEDGVTTALQASRGTALEAHVRDAIMGLLTDADPKVRAGAVMAVETFPAGFDARALIHILDRRPELFRGTSALAHGFPDIYWQLMRAIAGSGSEAEDVQERVRRLVVDPANGHWLLAGLTRHDRDWVLAHAREVLVGQPTRAATVLANLDEPRGRARFVEATRAEPAALRKAVAASLDEVVADPKERQRLSRVLLE